MRITLMLILMASLFSCTSAKKNVKNSSTSKSIKSDPSAPKRVWLPFAVGTRGKIVNGAFGKDAHSEKGNEYSWDFAVPDGTTVHAVEGGRVLEVFAPQPVAAGCDPKFSEKAWNVKIEHDDQTVAQYVHIHPKVLIGDVVLTGQPIGRTSMTGWICEPHLHFGIYRSKNDLYHSQTRKTIPVYFWGLPDGEAKTHSSFIVPENHDLIQ